VDETDERVELVYEVADVGPGVQQLEADAAVERLVVDEQSGREPALAERGNDAVAVGDERTRFDVSNYVSSCS